MMCCKQTEYVLIESKRDIDFFLERTNGLHDGYIIGVQYEHRGHTGGNPHWIDPTLSELKIRIMVTSINDAVVELVFQALSEWQVRDNAFDITDTAISFTDDGNVIWADDCSTVPDIREKGSFAIARSMKWHFI